MLPVKYSVLKNNFPLEFAISRVHWQIEIPPYRNMTTKDHCTAHGLKASALPQKVDKRQLCTTEVPSLSPLPKVIDHVLCLAEIDFIQCWSNLVFHILQKSQNISSTVHSQHYIVNSSFFQTYSPRFKNTGGFKSPKLRFQISIIPQTLVKPTTEAREAQHSRPDCRGQSVQVYMYRKVPSIRPYSNKRPLPCRAHWSDVRILPVQYDKL